MSTENQNNSGDWKSKLDELDSLPGETIPDKNAAWEKLHERLRGKKRSNKLIWYWVAAACLLLAMMIPWITTDTNENNLVQNNNPQIQIKEPSVHENLSVKKKTLATIPVVTVEKTIAPKIAIKKDNINTIAVAKKEPLITNNQVDDNDINSFKQVSDSPVIAVVAITPVIKKLKVVHINELGDPVEISPDVANKRDLHSFQLKLAGQEVYINPSTAFNKTGFTILKTKSSPN